MSSKFPNFVAKFTSFKSDNNMILNYIFSRGYGWRLGVNAKQSFSTHLEEQDSDQITDSMKKDFKLMFENEHDLLGIPVIGTCSGEYADKVFLYKISEKSRTASFNDVDFAIKQQLMTPQRVQDPITNLMFYWNYCMKIESLSIKDSVSTYFDSMSDKNNGSFVKLIDKLKISGTINYKTSAFELSRVSTENKNNFDSLVAEHNIRVTSEYPLLIVAPFDSDKDNFNLSYIAYEAPVKVLWTYDMSE